MNNSPEEVTDSVRHQIVEPIVDVLAGRLAPDRISLRLAHGVALRLAVSSRKPKGRTAVRTVWVQALPGSLEATAVVMMNDRGYGLGIRIEQRDGHPMVVRLAAPGLI